MSRRVYPASESGGVVIADDQRAQRHNLEAIGQLAAGIAHEINTPIQYVGDNLRFLADATESAAEVFASVAALQRLADEQAGPEAIGQEVRRLLAAAERADLAYVVGEIPRAVAQSIEGIHRVSRIVRAMKDFAHPHGEGRVPVDLNDAIETTLLVAHNHIKYVADTQLDLAPDLPHVWGHPDALKQVLLGLLTNAANAIAELTATTPGRGLIAISTRPAGAAVELRIADNGTGIPDDVAPHVFEPFFSTHGGGRRLGHGLALAYSTIVNRHGGQIWFDTEPGHGTTFFVRLPLRRSPREE